VAIQKSDKKYFCFACGHEIFWSDIVRSKKTHKRIPVNEDESVHFCSAVAAPFFFLRFDGL
jgi:hypothetical protein